jgi:hypothetical protein
MAKDKIFDPWKSSYEEAIKLQEDLGNPIGPQAPIFQKSAADHIQSRKEQIKEGDGFEVLSCIRWCINHGLVAPIWLCKEFNKRYDSVLNLKAKSWDDKLSFGKPYKKSFNLNAAKKEKYKKFTVHAEVIRLLNSRPKPPIDDGLFELVGKQFGIGKTLAKEYYYKVEKEREKFR